MSIQKLYPSLSYLDVERVHFCVAGSTVGGFGHVPLGKELLWNKDFF